MAAADATASALGLRPIADLRIDQDVAMGFRVYAAAGGNACAMFLGDQSMGRSR